MTSYQLLDEILKEVECPISLERMDYSASLSCNHNLHKDSAILLCGENPEKPNEGAQCPLCKEPIKYWKRDHTIENIVPKLEALQKQIITENEEYISEIARLSRDLERMQLEILRRSNLSITTTVQLSKEAQIKSDEQLAIKIEEYENASLGTKLILNNPVIQNIKPLKSIGGFFNIFTCFSGGNVKKE